MPRHRQALFVRRNDMKEVILIILIVSTTFTMSCGKEENPEPHYIKVLVFGRADSINTHNKGVGLAFYSYMDLHHDSVIFRFLSEINPKYQYTTYTGKINKLKENDTIKNAIAVLSHIQNGMMKETFQFEQNSTYCGSEIYIEYKCGSKEKYVYFLQSNLDKRLEAFTDYFFNLQSDYWIDKTVSNDIINIDSITILALKRLGLYDSIPIPKTPLAK